jgi:hypothetical protein
VIHRINSLFPFGTHVPRLDKDLADAPVLERSLQVPGSVPDAEFHTEVVVRFA